MDLLESKLPTVANVGGRILHLQPLPLTKRSGFFSSLLEGTIVDEITLLPNTDPYSPAFELVWLYLNGAIDTFADIRDYFPSLKEIDWREVWNLLNYFMVPLDSVIVEELYFNIPELENYIDNTTLKLVETAITERRHADWKVAVKRRKIDLLYDTKTTPPYITFILSAYILEGYTLEDIQADPSIIEREIKDRPEPCQENFYVVDVPKYNLERDLITSLFGRSVYSVDNEEGTNYYHTEDFKPVSREVVEATFNNVRLENLDGPPRNIITEYILDP